MNDTTLIEYMDLIRDGSPSSGTHWTRCRGPQRNFAKSWLDNFDAKRQARRQARRWQAGLYCLTAIITVYTIYLIKSVWK